MKHIMKLHKDINEQPISCTTLDSEENFKKLNSSFKYPQSENSTTCIISGSGSTVTATDQG